MKNLKKALAVSCAGLLLFAPYNYPVFPEILTAYAETTPKNISEGNITISETGEYSISGETTEHKIIINGDCTVKLTNATINLTSGSPITIAENKTVTLILSGENTLSSSDSSAIVVNSGAKLVIQVAEGAGSETGTLNATGSESGTDIGGDGDIEIQSGTVNATITSGDVKINNGAIVNGCTYPPKYTITIPSDITFEPEKSVEVKVSDVDIEDGKTIAVGIGTENSDGGAAFLIDESGTNKIKYSVEIDGEENTYLYGQKMLYVTREEKEKSLTMKFALIDQIKYAGSYTDTLTFTVSMENK